MLPNRIVALAASLATLAFASLASAQYGTQCDSCASCTTALASPRARVELSQDVSGDAPGPCIVVRGDGAQLNGRGHSVRASGDAPAVRLEGSNTMARNVRVSQGAVGIEVAQASNAVVFHNVLHVRDVGVRVEASEGTRISRTQVVGARVGIAFGDAPGGRCAAGTTLRSPGAVLHRNVIEGGGVGIAACEAAPVFTENTVRNNAVGLALGAPARGAGSGPAAEGPYDVCTCAPTLDRVTPATALLYSTGCGGCEVHEGWLRDLGPRGRGVRVRETGREHLDAAQRYDDFVDHCAPEITDAIGIPGCVPNYTCLASGVVFKTRGPDDGLEFEAQIDSAEGIAQFASQCAAVAAANFTTGHNCLRYQFRGNSFCNNRESDVRALPGAQKLPGSGDACRRVEGFADANASGCANPCTADGAAPGIPQPVLQAAEGPGAAEPQPSNPAPSAPSPTAITLPAQPSAPADESGAVATQSSTQSPRGPFGLTRNALYAIGGVALAGLIGVILRSSRTPPT